jgi:hypothetical protein
VPSDAAPQRHPLATVIVARNGADVARWSIQASARHQGIDLSFVDDLARLQVAMRRLGCSIRVADDVDGLRELLDLVGLGVQVDGQPERREQRRVEEAVVADDAVT